ncbi:MAG: transglutaminase domain-containing protein [Gaiellaceae bacterium]
MPRTIALGALAGSLIAWNWLRLEKRASPGQAALILLLALAPAAARGRRMRLAACLVAFALAAGSAFRLGPDLHYPGRLLSRFGSGFVDFYDVGLPFDPAAHRWMNGAILLGVFAFTLVAVLAIDARRARPAAAALLVGAGWPATLLAGHDFLRGSALLAGVLVLLVGLRERPRGLGHAAVAGAAVILAGVAASSSPALAKHGFLHWQSWDLYSRQAAPVDVSYVWSSSYSGLTFPHKTTVVLRIQAPARAQYWQATALSAVVDGHWIEDPAPQQQSSGYLGEPGLVPPGAGRAALRSCSPNCLRGRPSGWVEQHVTVEGLRDTHLVGATVPVQFDASKLGVVLYDPAGMAFVGGLKRGDRYTAWSYEPDPTPAQLASSRPVYPQLISVQGKYLEIDQRAWVAPFGTPGREAAIQQLFSSARGYRLAPFKPLYRLARRVAGGAKSPYAAAVALESWFRIGGNFVYDQHPPRSTGRPALVDFVTRTRSGYCQHFAGAMTLMLRYLGIPARVAAGFSSGHYDKSSGEWIVTDHDAHEWVEVWFRGWGWVPFDPTPGRGGVAGAYSASSKAFDAAAAALVLAGKEGLRAFAGRRSELGFAPAPVHVSPDVPNLSAAPVQAVAPHRSRAPGLLELLLLVVAGLVVTITAAKLALRRARYLTNDPRRLAAACRRELRDILLDQLVDVPASATLAELALLVEAEFGVSAAAFGRHATAARFGPRAGAREAAREMRRALRAVRRGVQGELTRFERFRGLVSLRSLGFA